MKGSPAGSLDTQVDPWTLTRPGHTYGQYFKPSPSTMMTESMSEHDDGMDVYQRGEFGESRRKENAVIIIRLRVCKLSDLDISAFYVQSAIRDSYSVCCSFLESAQHSTTNCHTMPTPMPLACARDMPAVAQQAWRNTTQYLVSSNLPLSSWALLVHDLCERCLEHTEMLC